MWGYPSVKKSWRCQYTDEELRRLELKDWQVDERCAIRDGLVEYAARCRQRINELDET